MWNKIVDNYKVDNLIKGLHFIIHISNQIFQISSYNAHCKLKYYENFYAWHWDYTIEYAMRIKNVREVQNYLKYNQNVKFMKVFLNIYLQQLEKEIINA